MKIEPDFFVFKREIFIFVPAFFFSKKSFGKEKNT